MDPDLPKYINYWIESTSKHDCFFNVGPKSGPNTRIGAIKCLLFAHSEVLQKMLDESPLAETGDIPVVDSDPDTFMNFLKCIYGGADVVVRKLLSYEKSLELLYLCEKYLTLELKEHISSLIVQLYQPLTTNQVLTTLSNPACFTTPNDTLSKAISQFIQNNTEEIIYRKSFEELDLSAIIFIAKQEQISTKEINLWRAVFKWAQKRIGSEDPKALRSCLKEVVKHVRFCAMDASDFCVSVVPTNVLTKEEVYEVCNSIGSKRTPNLDELCCEIHDRSVKQPQEITFTYVLNNIKQFTGITESPKYKLGGFNWNLLLMKKDNRFGLSVFLNCSKASNVFSPTKSSSPWKCFAEFEITIVSHESKKNFTRKLSSHEFTSKEHDWGFFDFYHFDDLINIKEGYIKNNSVVIVTRVELKSED